MLRSISLLAALGAFLVGQTSADDLMDRQPDGSDLTSFVTRPDFQVPRFNVTKHNPDRISEGYWFLAPYSRWAPRQHMAEYMPSQVGPMVFDGDGNLVWNGAQIDDNHNVQDFRPYQQGNETWMSYMLAPMWEMERNDTNGSYITLDPTYKRQLNWVAPARINGHEFKIIEGGTKALTLFTNLTWVDPPNPASSESDALSVGKYLDDCSAEFDMTTKEILYEWCPLQHGFDRNDTTELTFPHWSWGWHFDYMHANSVDKFANGDMLFSSRFMWGVFRVSRADNSLTWALGGKQNSFVKDFEFRYQHNAKIISENDTTTIITLLDNASAEKERGRESANCSSAMMIALHTAEEPMRAELLHRWYRPDGDLSRKRGNVDILNNGNIWVSWSDFGYHSEQGMDGEVVMEARFASDRLSTYRAYKAPFVGRPHERPVLKAFQYSAGDDAILTAHVSWNGATETRFWRFEGCRGGTDEVVTLATVPRDGFETSLRVPGSWTNVTAIGLDVDGNVLGQSSFVNVELAPSTYSVPKPEGYFLASSEAWAAVPHTARARVVSSVVLLTLFAQSLIIAAVVLLRRRGRSVAFQVPLSTNRYDDHMRHQTRRMWLAIALLYRTAQRWTRSLRGAAVGEEMDFAPLPQDDGSCDSSEMSLGYSDMSNVAKEYH